MGGGLRTDLTTEQVRTIQYQREDHRKDLRLEIIVQMTEVSSLREGPKRAGWLQRDQQQVVRQSQDHRQAKNQGLGVCCPLGHFCSLRFDLTQKDYYT